MIQDVSISHQDEFTTRGAARVLGLAVSTVQQMVNRGDLHGWKTPGGHRRISHSSMMHWLEEQQRRAGHPAQVQALTTSIDEPVKNQPSRIAQRLFRYPQRVLLIEDSVHFQTLAKLFIGHEFPQVDMHVAEDGVDGLVMASRLEPDVLIVDILLPGIDGAVLLAKLRVHPLFQHCHFIVLTALEGDQLAPYAFALQGLPVVHKPRLMLDLPSLLTEMLEPTFKE